jgi:hypothetical protein
MSAPLNHASFANVWRLAATMAEQEGRDLLVIDTGNPMRRYVVDERPQGGAVVATLAAAPENQVDSSQGCECRPKARRIPLFP